MPIILDFGSGNTCRNNTKIISEMIDELAKIDIKRQCIIKWQLFLSAGDNEKLKHSSFEYAYIYARNYGFQTTASVFDVPSLDFLLNYKIPFVKIANNKSLYNGVMSYIPASVRTLASWSIRKPIGINLDYMCCISKYPAKLSDYEEAFNPEDLIKGISDHTTDFKLYNKYNPEIYEVHYKLYNNTGLDAGPFARTPLQLKEILK
jgi:hypothetical protein